ncbi:MAG: sulfurtransferase [Chromatiales bacterium 21-64-14]|nr:MAG: sulfurtransferase [Chromatiales bacterium 21-64-14]HQU15204.1 sulfurtransferase [Gammaproteobacteria bacterium]
MPYPTLLPPAILAAHLTDPAWVVFDCRFNLADPGSGVRAYRAGHVPGAHYADLDQHLSGPKAPGSGRHPLPDPAALAARLGAWGVGATTQVVAYDDQGGVFAARLWWLLRWLGHDAVAVLDGGWARWRREGGPEATVVPVASRADFPTRPRPDRIVDAAAVHASLSSGRYRVVDARSPERFRGEVEPLDPVAGHIPGARNHPYQANLDADGNFLSADRLREGFAHCLEGCTAAQVVQMCGSGVSACHNLLAMERAGLSGARLYPGSWSEWVADPGRPIDRGVGDRG